MLDSRFCNYSAPLLHTTHVQVIAISLHSFIILPFNDISEQGPAHSNQC